MTNKSSIYKINKKGHIHKGLKIFCVYLPMGLSYLGERLRESRATLSDALSIH